MSEFELQTIGLILVAFVIGVAIGYLLRTRVFPAVEATGEAGGLTLESRQERQPHSLLRGGKARRSTSAAAKPATVGKAAKPKPAADKKPSGDSAKPDNLQDIKGIGAVLEKKLNAMGITRFEQIAAWTEDDVAKVDDTLNFRGRIQRERWVEQARQLAERTRGDS
jgi:predicted flap endonuclease-1-like 5' DNA nuclease